MEAGCLRRLSTSRKPSRSANYSARYTDYQLVGPPHTLSILPCPPKVAAGRWGSFSRQSSPTRDLVNARVLTYPWVRRTAYPREDREARMVRGTLEVKRHRFTAMGEAGVLGEDDRVELVDGEIVDMAPIGSRHLSCVVSLTQLLVERAQGQYFVSVQNPVRLSERDEPQPDLTLLKRRPDPAAPSPPHPGTSWRSSRSLTRPSPTTGTSSYRCTPGPESRRPE
jgi:Putative restriction endonuclease